MRFSLDVRRAKKGDCLLLHFGTKTKPGLVMIDGGPSGVFGPHLEPRIQEIKTARNLGPADALPVDVLMISHVDDDHIKGILDFTKQEIATVNALRPRLLNVKDLWHNSFDEVIKHNTTPLASTFTAQFGSASTNGQLPDAKVAAVESAADSAAAKGKSKLPSDPIARAEIVRSTLQVLSSIPQGFQLRRDAERLNYSINNEFDGELIVARPKGKRFAIGPAKADVKFTVVGPLLAEIDDLRKEHLKWLEALKKEGKKPPAALAAYVDDSVPNLSSLVMLAEVGKKRILLTGDARGDKVVDGLEMLGLLKPGKTMTVDVLKVPHHGSSNNLEQSFFERILASHYVFSGNGEHGNPERESMEMLFAARGTAPFTIHLTYPIDEIDVGRKEDWKKEQQKEKTRKAKTIRPNWSPKKQSLQAFFDSFSLAPGQSIKIVDEHAPHVIDLLDPIGF